ncbi:MAG: hypothetical protein HY578_09015 [Nitrospinae bacterium]|nr:hypothetical protein [Nitrospinota bacterium]
MNASRITKSTAEEASLAAICDALLPKLLSGEIRMRNVERFGEEVL